jgi:hypothetical protein
MRFFLVYHIFIGIKILLSILIIVFHYLPHTRSFCLSTSFNWAEIIIFFIWAFIFSFPLFDQRQVTGSLFYLIIGPRWIRVISAFAAGTISPFNSKLKLGPDRCWILSLQSTIYILPTSLHSKIKLEAWIRKNINFGVWLFYNVW